MKKTTKSILILLGIFLFCVIPKTVSQTILQPELKFSSACDNGEVVDFEVVFKYTAVFNSDNQFTIELSDANGGWSSPINVGTVTTENSSFIFSRTFQLPDNTFGQAYKIRLVSTSPAMVSPDSQLFQAYKMVQGTLVLNDFENVVLCDNDLKEITLNTDQNGEYQWYKDDILITTTTEPKLNVTSSGKYQAKIDYGTCGFIESTLIDVVVFSSADSEIKGSASVEICGDESYTFEANVNDDSYTYNWYLDNDLVQSSNSSIYTTPTAGQFGNYHLEIDTGSCQSVSNSVELKQRITANFNVNTVGALQAVILPNETKELCIEHDATSASIQWYKDGVVLSSRTEECMNATESGEYFARVTKNSTSDCNLVVDSDKYMLISATSYNITIRTTTDYEECNSKRTKLSIVGIKAIGSDNQEYDLSTEQIEMLNYQWNKNSIPVEGAIDEELIINSYEESGVYTLTVSSPGIVNQSNELDIKLIEVPEISATSISNSLCAGGNIIYTITNPIATYNYQWIKDGTDDVTPADPTTLEVTEVGEYVLKFSGFGCNNELDPINVVLFDDSAVTITPSEKVVMEPGSDVTILADGGESYEWFEGEDTTGIVLSTTEELTVNTLGYYTVAVTVGNCMVIRTVEVVEPDDQIIVPNIVSPNQDGINDTWLLSNSYAFQPSVTIILFDSNGKKILNTTDYKNDWPTENLGNQKIFYYKIIKDDTMIKAGTISVLE